MTTKNLESSSLTESTHTTTSPVDAFTPTSWPSSSDPVLCNIAESLRAIALHLGSSPQMGFVHPPKPTWIYANRTQGDRWYWRTPSGDYELCPTAALSGHLVQLEFREVTRRNQPVWKLWATLEADRTYVIETGRDSVFAKSLLAAIATLTPSALRQLVTLEVSPADQNEESLFCNLYADGERVYGKWGENPNWDQVAETAMAIVTEAHGKYSSLDRPSDRLSSDCPSPQATASE